jgi:hypothetical protein
MLIDLVGLESSAPVRFIATSPFLYPLISALHLFGIALLFGSIVPVDHRLLRVVGPQFDDSFDSLIRLSVLGFCLAAPSGALLASVRISQYVENVAFLIKMAILLTAGANALMLHRLAGSRSIAQMVGRPAGQIATAASLCLWTAAILAGRWIAFS